MPDDPQSGPSKPSRRSFLLTTGSTAAATIVGAYLPAHANSTVEHIDSTAAGLAEPNIKEAAPIGSAAQLPGELPGASQRLLPSAVWSDLLSSGRGGRSWKAFRKACSSAIASSCRLARRYTLTSRKQACASFWLHAARKLLESRPSPIREALTWSYLVMPGQSSVRNGDAGRPSALKRLHSGLSAQA